MGLRPRRLRTRSNATVHKDGGSPWRSRGSPRRAGRFPPRSGEADQEQEREGCGIFIVVGWLLTKLLIAFRRDGMT